MSQEKELVFSSSLKLMQNSIRIPDAVYITGGYKREIIIWTCGIN
jgi:hypothetical protein